MADRRRQRASKGGDAMGKRVLAKCEGCKREIVLAQEDGGSSAHLSVIEFQAFLRDHEGCRAKVTSGPHITWHTELAD
jgi:hypothetical protein